VIFLTALAALIVSVLALTLRPGRALGVVVASALVWPEYARLPLGLAQMSVPRFGALFLVLRMATYTRSAGFRLRWADGCVLALWLWSVAASAVAGGDQAEIVYQLGRGLDTVFLYFAARLAVSRREDFGLMAIPLAAGAVWMAIAGVGEAVLSRSPYEGFRDLPSWGFDWGKDPEYRWGFLRAQASTTHAIYFGTAMVIVAGILWSLRGIRSARWVAVPGTVAALIAAVSSLSSGPQSGIAFLVLSNLLYFRPGWIKPALVFTVVMSVAMEVFSKRHFIYVFIDLIAFGSSNGWYRARLLDVAIQQWRDYWLVGIGGGEIFWGPLIDGRLHTDVVNNFIIVALYGGLLAVALFPPSTGSPCATSSARGRGAPTRWRASSRSGSARTSSRSR
jgi:hypothetical protein